MANYSVSARLYFDGVRFKPVSGMKLSALEGQGIQALPPIIDKNTGTPAIGIQQTPYSEFAFNHITPPDYGNDDCIARVTGVPINKPDFVADYHFISLARSIDYLLMNNNYQGKITGNYNTPGANK